MNGTPDIGDSRTSRVASLQFRSLASEAFIPVFHTGEGMN